MENVKQQEEQKITTFSQALQLLVDGIHVAQKRGSYSLEESAMLFKAIQFLKQVKTQKKPLELEKIEEI